MSIIRRGLATVLALLLAMGTGGSMALASPDSPNPVSEVAVGEGQAAQIAPLAIKDGMSLTKSVVGSATPKPGEHVTYQLILGCSSNTEPCNDAVLVDLLPEPLVLADVDYTGFAETVTEKISDDKTQLELKFNETSNDRPGVGINAGETYTVTVTALLPLDASPEFGGLPLINSATLTSKAGEVTDEAEVVTPLIDAEPNAAISKDWAQDSLLEKSGSSNAVTLGGIKNTSKAGATSLTITEPSGDTDPFESVAFTGFGDIVAPEGADELTVSYFVGTEKYTLATGAPNAPPVFPVDLDLSTITGFEFVFSSSKSTETLGGIAANGTAGSILLNTVLRNGAVPGEVINEVSITAQTPKGNSSPTTANDSFVIEGTNYSVEAGKSFSPDKIVAGEGAVIGDGRNQSTVTLGAKNTSNQALKTLSIKEPATGTDPFGAGIDFEKFESGTWPAGATKGIITINGTPYALTDNNGQLAFPEGLPSGSSVKSFEIRFDGEFAPQAGFELGITVLGATAGTYTNTVVADGEPFVGGERVTDETSAVITVVEPTHALIGKKGFSPDRVEGVIGDKTTAVLSTKVDPAATNMDVRAIVQTDEFGAMVPSWKPTTVSVNQTQGASHVLVEVKKADTWVAFAESDGAAIAATALDADVLGVRITYTRATGSFPGSRDVVANVGFELTINTGTGTTFNNVLGINNGQDSTGTVTADEKMTHDGSKTWGTSPIVQKPNSETKPTNMNPTSQLNLSANNTSAFAVDSLSLIDPKADTANPFNFVNITGFTARVTPDSAKPLAKVTFTFESGAPQTFTGADALTPILADGKTWADVIGLEYSLLKDGTTMVPRDAKFDLTVGTALRDKLRGSSTLIDAALDELTPAYTIPNAAESAIARSDKPTETKTPSKELVVTTENSVDIAPVLLKFFNPAGPASFFTENGVPTPIDVALSLNTGTHPADKIVIEDVDPTFWNAFDFASWNPVPTSNRTVTIEYFTGATFTTVDGKLEVDGGTWITKSPDNAAVQGIRVTMQGADYEPLDKQKNDITFKVMPRYTLRTGELNSIDGKSPNPGESKNSTVANTATAEAERLGKDHDVKDVSAEYQFVPGNTVAGVDKSSDARNNQIAAGRELNYTIKVTNSGTEAILNPTITDKLPTDDEGPLLALDPEWISALTYSFDKKFSQAPEGTSMTTDPELVSASFANGNEVVFGFPSGTKLYPGESYTIVLPVTVRAGVPAQTDMRNHVEFGGDNSAAATDDSDVNIIEGQAYASRKLVREVPQAGQTELTGVHNLVTGVENDTACYDFGDGFYRYPCVVETKPGGTAEWKLSVINTGNVPSQHMEILDVFPFVGDTGVTASQAGAPRGSKWTPTLLDVKLPEVPEGTDMVLSYLTGDPATCKPNGLDIAVPWDGCDTNWVTDRPANPKEIHGIKLVMGFPEGLAPNDSVSLTFTTESATELPEGAERLAPAWNAFGYAAKAQVNGVTDYRSQEPIKTGITFSPVDEPMVSVGDYVWIDTDKDGIQDDGEIGIKDVTLVLTGPDGKPVTDVYGNLVLPTMTDGDGFYTFENLPVLEKGQKYTVSIDREASEEVLRPYLPTKVGAGGDKGKDSSGWVAETDPESDLLTSNGDRDPTLDFGFFLNPGRVSVGDYVWVDSTRDGVQTDGEPGIKDVVLVLTGPDGKPVTDVFGNAVDPVATDENGAYTFENLPVLKDGQSYTVSIDKDASKEALAKYIPTVETEGNREGDSSTWTATSEGLTQDGQRDPTLDFGFVLPKVSVGDYVWVDSNRDGLQTEGESGIKDVVLVLTGPDEKPVIDVFGTPVAPVVTDENGFYTFENLPVLNDGQSYTVSIDREASKDPLAPYVPTIDTGADRETNSSTWKATSEGLTQDGQRDPTLDFGFVLPKVSVGDYVWVDSNRNGRQDPGEPGIKDVVLVLTGPDGKAVTDVFGNPVDPVATDENGAYTFMNLPVLKDGQSYTVSIDKDASKEALAKYIPTVETEGNREGDSSTWTATSEGLTQDGQRDPTLDFGFVLPMVSVGDYVWVDTDRNGVQGDPATEPGIKDVVLVLTGPDGEPVTDVFGNPVAPVSTDKGGKYSFENLPVLKDGESYTVSIDRKASAKALAPYQPTQAGQGDRDGDSSTWTAASGNLVNDGDRDPTLDFGFVLIPEPVTPVDPTDPPVTTPPAPEPTTPADPTEPSVTTPPTPEPVTPVNPTGPVVTLPAAPEPIIPVDPTDPAVTTAAAPETTTAAQPTDPLSHTGFSGAMMVGMAFLLTMLGGGAVALTARRRRTSTTRH